MTVLYVTGCNAHYFITALAFLETLRARVPAADIRVCDFGLTAEQRDHRAPQHRRCAG